MRSLWRTGIKYIAHPIPIPLYLFTTGNTDLLANWDLVLPVEQIRLIPVPGTHISMMRPPHVASLGAAISEALRQTRETNVSQPEKEYWPLLSIRDGSSCAPVLCIPGAGSTIINFLDLVESLGNIGPIEGLQPRGMDGVLVPHTTVQSAARAYLQCIKQKYPHGSVHLLGHSFGGWVAFEVAQLLQAAGRSVSSLIILDSNPPESNDVVVREYSRTEALMELVNLYEQFEYGSLNICTDQMEALDPIGQLELLCERLVRSGLIPRETQAVDLVGIVRTFETALRTRYCPEKIYPYPVLLALANDTKKDQRANQESFENRVASWSSWSTNLKVWRSPGTHMTMLRKPHIVALADWLSSMLYTIES